MDLTKREVGDVVVVEVVGKILLGEGDVQYKRLIDELVLLGHRKFVVDLQNVPYMDSGGLGELVRCYTTVRRAGGEMVLAGTTKRVSDLLTITKLMTAFGELHEDVDAALEYFGQSNKNTGNAHEQAVAAMRQKIQNRK